MTQLQDRPVLTLQDRQNPSVGAISDLVSDLDVSHWRREYVHTPVPPPRPGVRITHTLRGHRRLTRTVLSSMGVMATAGLLLACALAVIPGRPWALADSRLALTATVVGAGDHPAGVALSSDARLVFVANAGAGTILVLRADDLSLVRSLPVPGLRPTAIAVDTPHHRVFVLDAASHRVRGVNTETGALTSQFATGAGATDVAVDPVRKRLYVANGADSSVWAYSLSSGRRLGTLSVAGRPISLALNTTSTTLYVLAGGRVSGYDSASLKRSGKPRSASGGTSITVDSGNTHLYLAGPGTMKRWDLTSGAATSMPITGEPQAIAASTPTGTVFVVIPDEDRLTRLAMR